MYLFALLVLQQGLLLATPLSTGGPAEHVPSSLLPAGTGMAKQRGGPAVRELTDSGVSSGPRML